ncbi:hypothetical protein IFM89_013148 [Coptis chinensis]|uniref:Uncharacterized protein n=1 Tax=Coptis chinensis TaxID=261450 RepID=A0A835M8P6_9MAGN|nr:hypothetical protein IFM89_013148 [Coptis chinensis]
MPEKFNMATQEENHIDSADLFSIIQQHDQEVAPTLADDEAAHEQEHYLQSIHSKLVIRQLPSQGLSFQIWPAANTLVSLLEQYHNQPSNNPLSPILKCGRPLRILELGSGTGLVGIAAAAILLHANVTITDLPHVLPNIQFNATANSGALELNSGTVDVRSLRWGEAEDMEAIGRDFDIVLGTDVVYHDNLYDPLLRTLQFFLGEESNIVFVMAHLRRWKKESAFFKKAKKMFQVQTIHSDAPLPGARIGVVVYSFKGKCTRM